MCSSFSLPTPLRVTSFIADANSATRVTRALQRVEVLVRAGEHFLKQDVAFTQPFEQGNRVGSQDLAGFLHFADRRDGYLA